MVMSGGLGTPATLAEGERIAGLHQACMVWRPVNGPCNFHPPCITPE